MENSLMQLAAFVTAAGVILVAVKKVFRFTKKTIYLVDEMVGDGEEGKPGVIKRVTIIEHELRPGDGNTLRDEVSRLGQWVREHGEFHDSINARKDRP